MAAGCRLRLLEPIKFYFGISAALMRSSMSAGVTEYLGAIDTFYRMESGRTAGCGRAVLVLSVAVLSIVITAPLGAFGMEVTYRRLLAHEEP